MLGKVSHLPRIQNAFRIACAQTTIKTCLETTMARPPNYKPFLASKLFDQHGCCNSKDSARPRHDRRGIYSTLFAHSRGDAKKPDNTIVYARAGHVQVQHSATSCGRVPRGRSAASPCPRRFNTRATIHSTVDPEGKHSRRVLPAGIPIENAS